MRILALNPYHGGSHQAFLEGWIEHSQHDFDVLTLPAYKWKWRMRHAAVTFAEQLAHPSRPAQQWDALFCTDMLNLAEFRGLCRTEARALPTVVYFHENQLAYPNRAASERDLHFAFTNITTCLAADAVWFNSAFHRDTYLAAVAEWMHRMPDHQLLEASEQIRRKASIHSPGIEMPSPRPTRRDGPLRVLWVSRWEHDKAPEKFFAALEQLQQRRVEFRLTVLGESYDNVPECFATARVRLAGHIDHWGYAPSREQYVQWLQDADVVVSTALHEFFGIAIVEAVAAGCFPLVPRRLAYPEVLGGHDVFFHDGTATGIAKRLQELSERVANSVTCWPEARTGPAITAQYAWPIVPSWSVAAKLDWGSDKLVVAE
jgi:glycosyltransferase involved in cell wall biosynthesis